MFKEIPYFLTDPQWFYYDEEKKKYCLTPLGEQKNEVAATYESFYQELADNEKLQKTHVFYQARFESAIPLDIYAVTYYYETESNSVNKQHSCKSCMYCNTGGYSDQDDNRIVHCDLREEAVISEAALKKGDKAYCELRDWQPKRAVAWEEIGETKDFKRLLLLPDNDFLVALLLIIEKSIDDFDFTGEPSKRALVFFVLHICADYELSRELKGIDGVYECMADHGEELVACLAKVKAEKSADLLSEFRDHIYDEELSFEQVRKSQQAEERELYEGMERIYQELLIINQEESVLNLCRDYLRKNLKVIS